MYNRAQNKKTKGEKGKNKPLLNVKGYYPMGI